MITYLEFVNLSDKLRGLQREYFKTDSSSPRKMQLLDQCRVLEGQLDKEIKRFREALASNAQTGMFSPARLRVEITADSPVLVAHNLTPGVQADTCECPGQYASVYSNSVWVLSPHTLEPVRLKQGEFKLVEV